MHKCKEPQDPDPSGQSEIYGNRKRLHGMWSSRSTFFSPKRVFQGKCVSTETDITSEGGNSKLFMQPLKIPIRRRKDGLMPVCQQSQASSSEYFLPSKTATSFNQLGLLGANEPGGRDSPPPHPRHTLEGSDIIPVLRRLCVNCGKKD